MIAVRTDGIFQEDVASRRRVLTIRAPSGWIVVEWLVVVFDFTYVSYWKPLKTAVSQVIVLGLKDCEDSRITSPPPSEKSYVKSHPALTIHD